MTGLAVGLGFTALIVLTAGFFLWKARQSGRDATNLKAVETTLKDVGVRNDVENASAARTADDRKRLRDQWTSG